MNTVIPAGLARAGLLLGLVLPVVSTGPAAAQSGEPAAGPDPVSRLVREALARPDDAAAWTGLAEALPELALTRDADPVTVFEASRLADSLATVPVERSADVSGGVDRAASVGLSGGMAGLAGARTWTRTRAGRAVDVLTGGGLTTSDLAALAPWLLVVLLLVAGPVLSRLRGRRSTDADDAPAARRGGASARRRGQGPVPGVSPRLWTVTTLADDGLPPAEIARRTGMAQDAVQVLLGLRDAPVPAGTRSRPGGESGSGYPSFLHNGATGTARPPSVTERAAGVATLRDELSRDARRLKGGRLTYGGGRNP